MKICRILLLATVPAWLVACKKNSDTAPAPVITGFSPAHGPSNTTLLINGSNFSTNEGENVVTMNGIDLPVIAASSTTITVKIPAKAGDGKITVKRANQTAESTAAFVYDYTVTVSTFAGSGNNAYAEGQGTAAKFSTPTGMVIDAQNNLYVADPGNSCIRKITPQGMVSTFVGKPVTPGYTDGTGDAVRLGFPQDIAYDKSGNSFYIVDVYAYTNRIRKITATGQVSTVAGGGSNTDETVSNPLDAKLNNGYAAYSVSYLAIDANKNIYVTDFDAHYIRKISTTGISTLAGKKGTSGYLDGQGNSAMFSTPNKIVTMDDGGLLVFDADNKRLRKIAPSGLVSTFAGNGNNVVLDATDPLHASFTNLTGALFQDRKGNVYLVDNGRLRLITKAGRVVSLTTGGDGYADGNGSEAKFHYGGAMVMDSNDNLFVVDAGNNRIRKIVVE